MLSIRSSRARGDRPWAAGFVAVALLAGCSAPVLTDEDMLEVIESFERRVAGIDTGTIRPQLRELAGELTGRRLRITDGLVAAPYIRSNETHTYYGMDYDPDHHLYLSEIDPRLDEALRHHRTWISVVTTSEHRQLSFEVAVDEASFRRLKPGQQVTIECELATMIRGKSVYCRAVEPVELDRGSTEHT